MPAYKIVEANFRSYIDFVLPQLFVDLGDVVRKRNHSRPEKHEIGVVDREAFEEPGDEIVRSGPIAHFSGIPSVKRFVRNGRKGIGRERIQAREMHHEDIGKRCTTSTGVVLTKRRQRHEEVWKAVVMPKCALVFHDLAHLADPFIIGETPLAANREIENVSRKGGVVDAVISADEERVYRVMPSAMK